MNSHAVGPHSRKDGSPPWPTRYIAARCEVPRDATPQTRSPAPRPDDRWRLRQWLHHCPRTLVPTNTPQGVHPSSNPVLRGLSGLVRVGPHPTRLAKPGGGVMATPPRLFFLGETDDDQRERTTSDGTLNGPIWSSIVRSNQAIEGPLQGPLKEKCSKFLFEHVWPMFSICSMWVRLINKCSPPCAGGKTLICCWNSVWSFLMFFWDLEARDSTIEFATKNDADSWTQIDFLRIL